MKFASIETGGTKIVCGIGNAYGDIYDRIEFPTETPSVTISRILSYVSQHTISAIGLGCFGPVDINPDSSQYGCIGQTPKTLWRQYNILNEIKKNITVPIGFDTDVNAAALGEYTLGAGAHNKTLLYITIGTGIGAGFIINDMPLYGLSHPEMGHIILPLHPDDNFSSSCPYHASCFEGLASGTALLKRWNIPAQSIPINHIAWQFEAHYIAQALVNYILTFSPEKIILGGGVMQQKHLFSLIHSHVQNYLRVYNTHSDSIEKIDTYIIPPQLQNNAGLQGGFILAMRAYKKIYKNKGV